MRVSTTSGAAAVEIADDGRGGADTVAGTGMAGMRDRAEAMGGHLLIHSPLDSGTCIRAVIPCA